MSVPAALRERVPLADAPAAARVKRLREHPGAPRFNHDTGDRLLAGDLSLLDRFARELSAGRGPAAPGAPSEAMLSRLAELAGRVPSWRARLYRGLDLRRHWEDVPTSSRRDLAERPWDFVPDGEPLERLVVYRTAGTTGHPISVPHHPLAVACYLPLLEEALGRHGVRVDARGLPAACFLLGSQVHTYTYATALSAWGGAGFAKLNLRDGEWPSPEARALYFDEFRPPLVNGDPVSLSEAVRLGLPKGVRAAVTTSTDLSEPLRRSLAAALGAPVVDWYSSVETGPIAYGCPRGEGLHLLPHDLFVEALDAAGRQVPDGTEGELTVSGGRNPFAPLLRYRTGDRGRLVRSACPCGDASARVVGLEGRRAVLFRSADGTPVTTVDLSRTLREFPLALHSFLQRADRSLELVVRPLEGAAADPAALAAALSRFFGALPLEVRVDPTLGADGTKVVAYRSELEEAR